MHVGTIWPDANEKELNRATNDDNGVRRDEVKRTSKSICRSIDRRQSVESPDVNRIADNEDVDVENVCDGVGCLTVETGGLEFEGNRQ